MRILYIFISVLLLGMNSGFSQACCSAGTPLLGSLELPATPANTLQLAFTYDYNTLQDVVSSTTELNDNSRERLSRSFLLELSYGFTSRFSISSLVTFNQQERTISGALPGFAQSSLQVKGVGDAIVLFKYSLIPLNLASQRALDIGFGPKIPFGTSDEKINGILIPPDMQPGTGAWDAVFWAYFYQGFLPGTRFNLFGNVSYRYTNTNDQEYEFGNEFVTNLGTSYRTDMPLDFSFQIRYRSVRADQRFEEDIANTGGQWFYLVPGVNLKIAKTLSMRFSGQYPIYRELNGTQLTTSYRLSGSIYYTIQ